MRPGFKHLLVHHLARPQPVWRGRYRLINSSYRTYLIESTDTSIRYIGTDSVSWFFLNGTLIYTDSNGGSFHCNEKEYYISNGESSCRLNPPDLEVNCLKVHCRIRKNIALCQYGSRGNAVKLRLYGTNYSQIIVETISIMKEIYERYIKHE